MVTTNQLLSAARDFGKGKIDTVQRTISMYESAMGGAIRSDLAVTCNIAFGAHKNQVLDVYVPPKNHLVSDARPVVVFSHQGGFIARDKSDIEAVVVGKFFSHRGLVCVIPNYRLAPDGAWPAGAEDVAAASRWVSENIASFGGNPDRMVLFGLSSGATHAATYALHRSFAADACPGYRGLILASGRYLLPPDDPDPNLFHNYGRPKISAYFGSDRALWHERQMSGNVIATKLPILLIIAELDNLMFEVNTIAMLKELTDKTNRMPRFIQVAGHNHISYYFHLGAPDDPVGPDLLDFVFRVTDDGIRS